MVTIPGLAFCIFCIPVIAWVIAAEFMLLEPFFGFHPRLHMSQSWLGGAVSGGCFILVIVGVWASLSHWPVDTLTPHQNWTKMLGQLVTMRSLCILFLVNGILLTAMHAGLSHQSKYTLVLIHIQIQAGTELNLVSWASFCFVILLGSGFHQVQCRFCRSFGFGWFLG